MVRGRSPGSWLRVIFAGIFFIFMSSSPCKATGQVSAENEGLRLLDVVMEGRGPPGPPADRSRSWLRRAAAWTGDLFKGVGKGILHAVPNLLQSLRERPLQTIAMVGGLIALGALAPTAALVVGGGLMAYTLYQTRGDATKVGEVIGETLAFGGLGWGIGRGIKALRRNSRPAEPTAPAPAEPAPLVAKDVAPRPPAAAVAPGEGAPLLAIAENGRAVPPNVKHVDGYYGTAEFKPADIQRIFKEGLPERGGTNMNLRDHVLENSRLGAEPTAFRSTAPYMGQPHSEFLTPLHCAGPEGIIIHVKGPPGWSTADLCPGAVKTIPGEAETVILSRIKPEHIYEIITTRRSMRDPDVAMIGTRYRNPMYADPPPPPAAAAATQLPTAGVAGLPAGL